MLRAIVLLVLLCAGCSYTSDYVPPRDGRARPIWQGDKVVIAAPAELPECASDEQPPPTYVYEAPLDRGYYVPPATHTHVHVGVVIIGRPPLLPVLPGVPGPTVPNLSGDGGKYVAVILAVGAIVAFPFIAMGLAMGHPEPEEEVANAIDGVNELKDVSRERMARCATWLERGPDPGSAGR